jgi:Noc2p family
MGWPARVLAALPQVLQLLAEHLAHWACSVAFPELAHLTTVQLRSLAKALPAERFRTQVGSECAVLLCAAVWCVDVAVGSPQDTTWSGVAGRVLGCPNNARKPKCSPAGQGARGGD